VAVKAYATGSTAGVELAGKQRVNFGRETASRAKTTGGSGERREQLE